MDLRWRHVENALIQLLLIKEEQMGAFRARLRHLRNVGVPDIPKVGSGTQIVYDRQQVIELYIALLITSIGISPKTASQAVFHVLKGDWKTQVESSKDDVFCILHPLYDDPQFSIGADSIAFLLGKDKMTAMSVINISKSIRDVDGKLRS